jgi:hypothetical protein
VLEMPAPKGGGYDKSEKARQARMIGAVKGDGFAKSEKARDKSAKAGGKSEKARDKNEKVCGKSEKARNKNEKARQAGIILDTIDEGRGQAGEGEAEG